MLSIGQFAEQAQVSARTVRYYESIGLLPKSKREENNYRTYDQKLLQQMSRIRDLQKLGFSLEDIKTILTFSNQELNERLQQRLLEIDQEVTRLHQCRVEIQNLLSVSNKIETGECLTEEERNLYMETIRDEIIKGLQDRYTQVPDSAHEYLKRDGWLSHPQIGEFIQGIKKCIAFAKAKNLTLGTARGSGPASLSLFGLGVSGVDPLKHEMIPERLATQQPFFHIDVEYERGQEFVDFCREINRTLPTGEIQAFKMPLIDVVQGVHRAIGKEIDYDQIDDNSSVVLGHFQKAEIEKIFQFDFSEDALVMNYERFHPTFLGLGKMTQYLRDQKISSFRDIINITAIWRPHTQEIIDRIELLGRSSLKPHSYGFLSKNIEAWLEPNRGVIVYHEDLMKIISEYTGWDLARSNGLRRMCLLTADAKKREQSADWQLFTELAPKPVVDLVLEESKWAFCMPHAISFARFTKQTAVLKSLYKNTYYAEIEKFEQKNGFRWDDIGIRMKGVSLHQG